MSGEHIVSIQILKAARELLEKGWTQGNLSAIKDGVVCYCMIGALEVAGFQVGSPEWTAISYVSKVVFRKTTGSRSIISYNDDIFRTKEQVLEVMDESMILAESEVGSIPILSFD